MLNHIQKLINELYTIDELLPKSKLSKILPELEFGIEIEMMHPSMGEEGFRYYLEAAAENWDWEDDGDYSVEGVPEEDRKLWEILEKMTGDWEVHRDGSLGWNGTEFVSPPMPYEEFLENIPKIVGILKKLDFYGDSSTGLHIGVSSNDINLSDKMEEDYEFYKEKYSNLVATILAYNIDSKGLFAQGDVYRQEEQYSKDLVKFLEVSKRDVDEYIRAFKDKDDEEITLDDIIHNSDHFIGGVRKFRAAVDKNIHVVSMTRRTNYIELRGLGGRDAFDNLSDSSYVKRLCVIIASQVSQEPREYTTKELYKILKPYLSEFFPNLFQSDKPSNLNKFEDDVFKKIKEEPDVLARISDKSYVYNLLNYISTCEVQNKKIKIQQFFLKYPIDSTYVSFLGEDTFVFSLEKIVREKFNRVLDKIAELGERGKAVLQVIVEKMEKRLIKLPAESVLRIVRGLSGTKNVAELVSWMMTTPELTKQILETLYNSGNENDRHNAVMYDLANKLDILSPDQIYGWAEAQASKGYFYTINGYLSHSKKFKPIYSKLFAKYPQELSQATNLPTEDMVNYVISGANTSNIPINTWVRELYKHYLNSEANPEKARELFVKLAVQNVSRLEQVDYVDPETQLEIVSQKPEALGYINAPFKATIEKAIELKGEGALRWVNSKTLKAYQEGGLR